jgi:ABC-type sugar transport system permease subunit/ABC-type glycerol-3-phosphate transport system substrate-binding protein
MTTKHFPLFILAVTVLLLPAILPATAHAGQSSQNEIETPLFEGGAGKDWFYFSARAYEVNGKWNLSTGGILEVKQAVLPIAATDDFDLLARFIPADSQATAWIPLRQQNNDYASRNWLLSAPDLSGSFTTDGRTLTGTLTVDGKSQPISATKPNPMAVAMYMDPRVEDKMRVRFLEGTFPEITNANNIDYWPLIDNGDIADLKPFLDQPNWEGDSTWRDSFLPGSLDAYTQNCHSYCIPLAYYANVIWYNKKMFREHGWTTPVTWDDLFVLCDQVKKAGIAPMAFQGRYPYYAEPIYDAAYYHIAGAQAWRDRDALKPGLLNNADGVAAMELVRKLAQNYFEPGALGMSHTESQLEFFLGHTAMIPCGSWLKSEMQGKIPDGFELGCFNLPIVKNTKADPSAINVHVEPYFVFSKAKHVAAAADYLRFSTSRRMIGRFVRMQDIPSAVRGANLGNMSKDLDDLGKIVANAKASYGETPSPVLGVEQVKRDRMYEILATYTLTPKQVADRYEQAAQTVKNQDDHPNEIVVHPQNIWKTIVLLTLLAAGAIYAIYKLACDLRRDSRLQGPRESLPKMRFSNILIFTFPSIAIYAMFVAIPSLRSFSWSMHTWDGLTNFYNMPYVGLLNFKRLLLESDGFWIAVRNNLFLMFVVPLFVIPLALFLAASISRQVPGSKFFRVVFFFPNLVGGVAATLLWLQVYNPQGGLANGFLANLGAPLTMLGHLIAHGSHWLSMHSAPDWLSHTVQWTAVRFHNGGEHISLRSFNGYTWLEPKHLNWALIPISIWGACGFNMILYLAAMESIPESYYEAATIDGASPWRQFWTITLPLIREILAISVVFLVIGGMKAFEIIWLLTNQQTGTENHVIATRMVQTMFQEFKVGEAAAIAVLLFLMVFVGSAATLRGVRGETVEM